MLVRSTQPLIVANKSFVLDVMKTPIYVLLSFSLTLASTISNFAQAAEKEIRISCGLASYKNIFEVIKDGFEKESGIKLTIVGDIDKTGTPAILKFMKEGKADIGSIPNTWEGTLKVISADKLATEQEIALLRNRVIGKDILKIFAHKDVGVKKTLTFAEAARIMNGQAKNWKEFGGTDVPIQVFTQNQYVATNAFFKTKVMNNTEFASNMKSFGSYADVIKAVETTPGSVSFAATFMPTPNTVTIQTADQIGRPIIALTMGPPSADMVKLFDYIKGRKLE